MALEAEFLSSLQHPHIIKIRGTSISGPGGFAQGPKGYFLIIDTLTDTLGARIKKWKKRRGGGLVSSIKIAAPIRSVLNKEETKSERKESPITEEQLNVALQISAALVYLHGKNVIFRDLKPDNVGFDVRGDVKIFDFGLACVMPSNGDPYEDKFEMSGAGSPRYMAPEVLVDEPYYNLKADVYTYGIVLWQMLSLQVPFLEIKKKDELIDYVGEYYLRHCNFSDSSDHHFSDIIFLFVWCALE